MKDFKEPMVYVYQNEKDSELFFYGKMVYQIDKGDTIFTSTNYDSDMNATNIFVERVDKEMAYLLSYTDKNSQNGSSIETNILKDQVFNFNGGDAVWSVGYTNYDFDFLSKFRFYNGQRSTYTWRGKELETIIINDEITITDKSPHNTKTYKFKRNTYYAKGLGIVKLEDLEDKENCWHLVDIKSIDEINLND